MSDAKKLTLKNIQVYDFMRKQVDADEMATNVKAIYHANKAEIAKRFNINSYQTFNWHVRRCMDYEAKTGNKIEVIRMDNREVVQ